MYRWLPIKFIQYFKTSVKFNLCITRQRPIPRVIPLIIYCFWFSPTPSRPPSLRMTCDCIPMIYCFWISPVLSESVGQPSVGVCPGACAMELVSHMANTYNDNSLDSCLSLSFNSENSDLYCSWLFTCFKKVHKNLWTLLKKYICHWRPMVKWWGFPKMENLILQYTR